MVLGTKSTYHIFRAFHQNTEDCILFLAVHRTLSKIDHMFGDKTTLNLYNKIIMTPCILSEHCGFNLDIKSKRNNRKLTNTWKLNKSLLNDK